MITLQNDDPEVWRAIQAEKERQQNTVDLIASESMHSLAVQEAQGSSMTNKYAEGYARKRWYAGCENVDTVEELAIERASKSLELSMPTCNHTLVRKPTWPSALPC